METLENTPSRTSYTWRYRLVSLSFALAAVFFSSSCGDGKLNMKIPGVKGPTVTVVEDKVVVAMVFEKLSIDVGVRFNIPKYPNSHIELGPDFQSGGMLLQAAISLQDIFFGEGQFQDPQKLPGGRLLPGVVGGQLPAIAFSIDQLENVSFYLGKDIFGLFIPLDQIDLQGAIISSRFYTGKQRIGNLSLISQDQDGKNGGFLLMLDMKGSTKTQLKNLAKKYH